MMFTPPAKQHNWSKKFKTGRSVFQEMQGTTRTKDNKSTKRMTREGESTKTNK